MFYIRGRVSKGWREVRGREEGVRGREERRSYVLHKREGEQRMEGGEGEGGKKVLCFT